MGKFCCSSFFSFFSSFHRNEGSCEDDGRDGSLEMMMTMPKDETEPEYRKNSHKLRMLRNYTKMQSEKKESRQRAMLMEWLLFFFFIQN